MMPDETTKKIDALMIPAKFKSGSRLRGRIASIADIAEPLLGVDLAKGERAYIRHQPFGDHFVSKCPYDTLQFPKESEQMGMPRYNWVLQDDGISYGYLVEGATSNAPAQ
jgi:hypothetical protein